MLLNELVKATIFHLAAFDDENKVCYDWMNNWLVLNVVCILRTEMYMYMYVYVYMYMYMYGYGYVYMYIYIYVYGMYMYMYGYVYMYIYIYIVVNDRPIKAQ